MVRLSLAAWEPVFRSFRQVLGQEIYDRLFPHWASSQAADVESACTNEKYAVWVADVDGVVAGFVALETDEQTKIGVVHMPAVDPAHQNQGLGTRLNLFALDRLQDAGRELAQVGTGGDPGHAAARRTYEKAGYTALPAI
ncbi:MAG: GNAT family N-acetyltransferase [Chloroflexota bacterium]